MTISETLRTRATKSELKVLKAIDDHDAAKPTSVKQIAIDTGLSTYVVNRVLSSSNREIRARIITGRVAISHTKARRPRWSLGLEHLPQIEPLRIPQVSKANIRNPELRADADAISAAANVMLFSNSIGKRAIAHRVLVNNFSNVLGSAQMSLDRVAESDGKLTAYERRLQRVEAMVRRIEN